MSIPKFVGDVLTHPSRRQAMLDEISALKNSGTLELVPLPFAKFVVGCKWNFCYQS